VQKKDYVKAGAQIPGDVKRRILAGMRKKIPLGWLPGCSCERPGKIPGVVLDPFCGSGTTGIAAKALGRSSVQIDLEERFIDLARARMDEKAPKINLNLGDFLAEK
jgi:SAM-dependent methyltransferase